MNKPILVAYYKKHQLYEDKPVAVFPSLEAAEAEVLWYKLNSSYHSASIIPDRRKEVV